jgi:putative toxin-antitoxin system antitoxin component (TIGR02293 family)
LLIYFAQMSTVPKSPRVIPARGANPSHKRPVAKANPKSDTPPAEFARLLAADLAGLAQLTTDGVSPALVLLLAEKLRLSPARIAGLIGLSRATLDRKLRDRDRLGLVESDRVVRYVQLWKLAIGLWGSEAAAQQWLTAGEQALGGIAPLDHAMTGAGARQVEDLMGQIAHGIAT